MKLLGIKPDSARVNYAIAHTYLTEPVVNLLGWISRTGMSELLFGHNNQLMYTTAFRRTFKLPYAQVCLLCRMVKHVYKSDGVKAGPCMLKQQVNDTYRVAIFASLTVQQLYAELASAKAANEAVKWNNEQSTIFEQLITRLVTGPDYDVDLANTVVEMDKLNSEAARDKKTDAKGKPSLNGPRAREGYGGVGGWDLVYTGGANPAKDYSMDHWPASVKRVLALAPLRKKKEAVSLVSRVPLANTSEAKAIASKAEALRAEIQRRATEEAASRAREALAAKEVIAEAAK